MTKPRLILHIGSQRAGSSSLQRSLRDARDALLGAGILYASLERGSHPFKHLSVSRAALSSDAAVQQAERDALLAEFNASGAHTLILSEESLWGADHACLSFFAPLKAHFQLDVVAFLRRPDFYIESLYNQALRAVRDGEQRPIDQYWREPAVRSRIEYHRILGEWRQVADQVHAIELGQTPEQTGLVASFFQRLGLSMDPLPVETVARPSPDGQAVLAMRVMREAGVSFDAGAVLAAAAALKEDPKRPPPLRHFLGRAERAAVMIACREDRRALERDEGITFAKDSPSEGADPVTRPSVDYLLALLGKLAPAGASGPAAGADSPRAAARKARRAAAQSDGAEGLADDAGEAPRKGKGKGKAKGKGQLKAPGQARRKAARASAQAEGQVGGEADAGVAELPAGAEGGGAKARKGRGPGKGPGARKAQGEGQAAGPRRRRARAQEAAANAVSDGTNPEAGTAPDASGSADAKPGRKRRLQAPEGSLQATRRAEAKAARQAQRKAERAAGTSTEPPADEDSTP